MRRQNQLLAAMAGAVLLAGGCAVGPNYKLPKMDVPARFNAAATQPAATEPTATQPIASTQPIAPEPSTTAQWWKTFNDPALDRLIDQARQSNLDLRAAEARVREARALRGVVSADYYPSLDASASYSRSRPSRNSSSSAAGPTGVAGIPIRAEHDLWQAGFDAAWELDVFGGVRRSVEAASADIQSAFASRNDVLVSVMGEVARNYVELRGFQRQIEIAQNNVRSQRETLELTRSKFRAGLTSDLDVARAEAQVATTDSTIPALQSLAAQAAHRLGVLIGHEPGALVAELGKPQPIPAPPAIPVGLPSELLRRRPDIRAAERSLASATARIGVATADLFPRFTLSGDVGLQAVRLKQLTDSGSVFWSAGPGVSWPIFNAGRIRSNIRVEQARTDQALANYEAAVLRALEEVENALVAYDREQARRQILVNAVDSNQRSVNLSQQLYQRGLATFLDVLEAQRSLFQSQDQLAQSDANVSANAVALFKALGGGWESDAAGG